MPVEAIDESGLRIDRRHLDALFAPAALKITGGGANPCRTERGCVKIPLYHLDAFTREPFGGNPAAVCRLDAALDDRTMLAIAAENNLPPRRSSGPNGADFSLRWFAPAAQLQLCGHATLATGHVLLHVWSRSASEGASTRSPARWKWNARANGSSSTFPRCRRASSSHARA